MRRQFLARLGLAALLPPTQAQKAGAAVPAAPEPGNTGFAAVERNRALVFPRDHGAHPEYRTEWWYITGWLNTDAERWVGFQLTFFRSKTAYPQANPSVWAARQLMLGHMALADPQQTRLLHSERAWRTLPRLAQYSEQDTELQIQDWTLQRRLNGSNEVYSSRARTTQFEWDLQLLTTSRPWLQGIAGYSIKGPLPQQASHYYSRPQMLVSGTLAIKAHTSKPRPVKGVAWLDHEWSSTLLDAQAVGWDWIGLNLLDGRSLMAFRIRRADGSVLFSHAALTDRTITLQWEPISYWRSPRTLARYPIAWKIRTTLADPDEFSIQPLMPDQELDGRLSTGIVYWEGAIEMRQGERLIGRGYLEMTGYHEAVKL
jgi:predicted secreted hydrolase